MWTFPFDYTDLRVRNARLPTFTSLESWNWRSRNSLLVQKGQRTALFLRLRSFSILRIFSLSFFFLVIFFQSFYIVCFFHDSGQALIRSFFFFYFPLVLFYFIFFFYFNTRRSHYRSAHVLRTLCSSLFYYRNLV